MALAVRPSTTCLRCLRTSPRKSSATASMAVAFSTSRAPSRPSKKSQFDVERMTCPALGSPSNLQRTSLAIRQASSSPSSRPQQQQQSIPDHILTWDRFFDLRRKRRWLNLGSSVITAVTSVGVLAPVLASQDIDSWGAQLSGLDPIIVLGISTFAVAAGGWLCGPTFGSGLFSLWAGRRGWNRLIAEKEKSFYARIKRYRADASSSSPQNPPPDYYGEKISSVKAYRRWLKDQKAFNLKKNKNVF